MCPILGFNCQKPSEKNSIESIPGTIFSDDKLDSFPGVWYQQVGGNTMSTLQVFGSSVWMAKCDHGQNAQRGVAGKKG